MTWGRAPSTSPVRGRKDDDLLLGLHVELPSTVDIEQQILAKKKQVRQDTHLHALVLPSSHLTPRNPSASQPLTHHLSPITTFCLLSVRRSFWSGTKR